MTFQIGNAKKIKASKENMQYLITFLEGSPTATELYITSTLVASKHQNTGEWEFFSSGHLLQCPNCYKFSVNDETLVCAECREEFSEDDICFECSSLIKGSCYYCKMD